MGSGSKMLCYTLRKYGNTTHIHSRKPPDNLEEGELVCIVVIHF